MTDFGSKLKRVKKANVRLRGALSNCYICPRRCGVNRQAGKKGYCRAPLDPVVYSYSVHHGEEPALSGTKGSGTIFFTHCNMKCVYCQNYHFSQLDKGKEMSIDRLARMMLALQGSGCHNINLVTPTHFTPQILAALEIALSEGLRIPVVYNTSGYELIETIKLLDGIVDIYLPDMRYSDNRQAVKYSDAPGYCEYNRAAVVEMHRQTGDLSIDSHGIAKRGLIIRLLALPGGISGTKETLRFIKDNLGVNTYLSLMSQYYPTFRSHDYSEISRGTGREEYQNIVDEAKFLGLNNGWIQENPTGLENRFLGTNIKPS